MKTVLITGCISGIGKATALYFAAQGWNVSATVLNLDFPGRADLEKHPNVFITNLDVTEPESIAKAISATVERFGGLDVVVNNAGVLVLGPFELATQAQIEKIYKVNALGPLYVTHAALPHFRRQKNGLIINVSSSAGRTILPFIALYTGTKHAVEGLSEALNMELVPLGIRVKIIEPGQTNTDLGVNGVVAQNKDVKDYDNLMSKFMAKFSWEGSAAVETVAKTIWTAATDGTKQVRYVVGKDGEEMIQFRKKMSDEGHEEAMIARYGFCETSDK